MGLFSKNTNETKYPGGQKHFVDVIKSTGNSQGNMAADALIWRHPAEDFNTNSSLVVMPGEVAIFVNNGNIEQVFEPNTYRLSTQNYPFISRLRNSFSGGISAFHCVVYFVRTNSSMEMKWGTDSPIMVRDKFLGLTTKLGARGAFQVRVDDPAMLLRNLLGATASSITSEDVKRYVRSTFLSKIKSNISGSIQRMDSEIMGIDAHMDEISQDLMPIIQDAIRPYGLFCISFSISAIDLMDDEYRRQYDEAIAAKNSKILNAQADRYTMDVLGDQWAAQQSFNVMNKMAENQGGDGGNGFAAMGIGLGMGMSGGMAFGNMAQQAFASAQQAYGQPQQQNVPIEPAAEDPIETLTKLKKLLDAGLIEQAEYDAKKADILSRF